MYNNFYEQFLELQKTGFNEWQKYIENTFGSFAKEGMASFQFNIDEFYDSMANTTQEFWKKVDESKEVYSAVLQLWHSLSEEPVSLDAKGALEVYEKWNKENFKLLRNSLAPNVPDYLKEFSDKLMDYSELSSEKIIENMKLGVAGGEELQKAMQKMTIGNPRAYIEFMEVLRKNYEETFGRMTSQPMFGKDMEFWRRYIENFDRYVKFNIAAAEFYAAMYEVIHESTQKVVEEYIAMTKEGEQHKTFDEFYKYWAKQVSSTYDKVLFSDEYGQLAGNMIDEMSRFKLAYDELSEVYLASLPIARKSDMDALHKTVYELKKEVRALKKAVKGSGKDE